MSELQNSEREREQLIEKGQTLALARSVASSRPPSSDESPALNELPALNEPPASAGSPAPDDSLVSGKGSRVVSIPLFPPPGSPLNPLFEAARVLHQALLRMHELIDEQIEAVKTGDAERIGLLVDSWGAAKIRYEQLQDRLINQIGRAASASRAFASDRPPVRMKELAGLYPEWAGDITHWGSILERSIQELSGKHRQLVILLEFAVEQNNLLMRNIYRLRTRESSHYLPDGTPGEVMPGSAVNHEA